MHEEDSPAGGDGKAFLYDYRKHLTSLCLCSLACKGTGRSNGLLMMALVVLGLATFGSFYDLAMTAEARFTGKPVKGNIN